MIEHRTLNRLMCPRSIAVLRSPTAREACRSLVLWVEIFWGRNIFTCNQQLRLRLEKKKNLKATRNSTTLLFTVTSRAATTTLCKLRPSHTSCDNRNHGRSDRPACAQIHRLKAPRATISTRNTDRPHRPHIPNPIILTLRAGPRAS